MDAGFAQVRGGQAWWFRQYAHEQMPFDRSAYESAEVEARVNQRGTLEIWKGGASMGVEIC